MKLISALLLQSSSILAFSPQRLLHYRLSGSALYESHVIDSETMVVTEEKEMKRLNLKRSLFRVIGSGENAIENNQSCDPVLAAPETKEPLYIISKGVVVADIGSGMAVELKTKSEPSKTYFGRTDTYLNLLESSEAKDDETDGNDNLLLKNLRPLLPPQATQFLDQDYVPMRDLFRSPFVSFAYERGWRNSFSRAGFPGIDKEFELVREFFKAAVNDVVVDMSCATGLMTRRLVKCGDFDRVIGCDYSDSMLTEARRRFNAEPDLGQTKLDLVRCDVGQIPMQDNSISALHAGAAMHCWPDVQQGVNEIYRVLKPGGRFFATTFLSKYFSYVQSTEGGPNSPTKAFQNFKDMEELRQYLLKAGFDEKNINVEIVGNACVVMRCEK